MKARANRDDQRVSVLQAVVVGILWAIGTITLNLIVTNNPVWIVIPVWSLMAIPMAVLWWWLLNRVFTADRRRVRRP